MMEPKQFEAGLRELAAIRARLRDLLEWEALVREEPRIPVEPGFDIAGPEIRAVRADLRHSYGFFMSLAGDLGEAIDAVAFEGKVDVQQCERWNRRIARLQQEVAEMRLGERLIKP